MLFTWCEKTGLERVRVNSAFHIGNHSLIREARAGVTKGRRLGLSLTLNDVCSESFMDFHVISGCFGNVSYRVHLMQTVRAQSISLNGDPLRHTSNFASSSSPDNKNKLVKY